MKDGNYSHQRAAQLGNDRGTSDAVLEKRASRLLTPDICGQPSTRQFFRLPKLVGGFAVTVFPAIAFLAVIHRAIFAGCFAALLLGGESRSANHSRKHRH